VFKLIILLLCVFELQAFASQEILVPTRNIKKGEILNQEDFSYESITKSNKNYISNMEFDGNVVRANKNLEQGKYLRKNDIYIDKSIVHKGEQVIVRFAKKNLSIEVPCIALTNGNLNEMIKVKTIDSNKILTGKIIADGTILIGGN